MECPYCGGDLSWSVTSGEDEVEYEILQCSTCGYTDNYEDDNDDDDDDDYEPSYEKREEPNYVDELEEIGKDDINF